MNDIQNELHKLRTENYYLKRQILSHSLNVYDIPPPLVEGPSLPFSYTFTEKQVEELKEITFLATKLSSYIYQYEEQIGFELAEYECILKFMCEHMNENQMAYIVLCEKHPITSYIYTFSYLMRKVEVLQQLCKETAKVEHILYFQEKISGIKGLEDACNIYNSHSHSTSSITINDSDLYHSLLNVMEWNQHQSNWVSILNKLDTYDTNYQTHKHSLLYFVQNYKNILYEASEEEKRKITHIFLAQQTILDKANKKESNILQNHSPVPVFNHIYLLIFDYSYDTPLPIIESIQEEETSTTQTSSFPIEKLPIDCFHSIIQFLCIRDVANTQCTKKSIYNMIDASLRECDFFSFPITWNLSAHKDLRCVLDGSKLPLMKSTTSLCLRFMDNSDNTYKLTHVIFMRLNKIMPALTELVLDFSVFSYMCRNEINLPSTLTSLTIIGSFHALYLSNLFHHIAKSKPNLKSLVLIMGFQGETFDFSFLLSFKELTKFHATIRNDQLITNLVEILRQLPLTNINLTEVQWTEEQLCLLLQPPSKIQLHEWDIRNRMKGDLYFKLNKLLLSNNPNFSTLSLSTEYDDYHFLPYFSYIQSFTISGRNVGKVLSKLICFANLKELKIEYTALDKEAMETIAALSPIVRKRNIKKLSIVDCRVFSFEPLKESSYEEIHISSCLSYHPQESKCFYPLTIANMFPLVLVPKLKHLSLYIHRKKEEKEKLEQKLYHLFKQYTCDPFQLKQLQLYIKYIPL